MNEIFLDVKNINLKIDNKLILKDVSFSLAKGDLACLIGPSGCGKTSLLRVIAGLEEKAIGLVSSNNKILQNQSQYTAPQKRKIGMVFQDYALFPHLTVEENITFGLAKESKEKRIKILNQMLELTKLAHLVKSYPHKLSGGEQQRVALARALALSPDILLLDEPFSNLDATLREGLAEDVKNILKELSITSLLVTHDQNEAFSFADKIGVMNNGHLEQFSSSYDIYHAPKNPFIAKFIGEGTFSPSSFLINYLPLSKKLENHNILIRPEDVTYDDKSELKARIIKKQFKGSHFLYTLEFENKLVIQSLVSSYHDHNLNETIGIKFEVDQILRYNNQRFSN